MIGWLLKVPDNSRTILQRNVLWKSQILHRIVYFINDLVIVNNSWYRYYTYIIHFNSTGSNSLQFSTNFVKEQLRFTIFLPVTTFWATILSIINYNHYNYLKHAALINFYSRLMARHWWKITTINIKQMYVYTCLKNNN